MKKTEKIHFNQTEADRNDDEQNVLMSFYLMVEYYSDESVGSC